MHDALSTGSHTVDIHNDDLWHVHRAPAISTKPTTPVRAHPQPWRQSLQHTSGSGWDGLSSFLEYPVNDHTNTLRHWSIGAKLRDRKPGVASLGNPAVQWHSAPH